MNDPAELICLFWTSAGVFPGQAEVSRFDFRERVEAAAKAGFKGIGIWHADLEACLRHRTLKEMRTILDDNAMQYVELEFLTDWFVEGPKKAASDRRRDSLLEASQALHAKHVKVGDFDKLACPPPQVAEAFAALCSQAEQYGATIGFEVMGCAMIDTLPDAVSMVETAGARNGGLILDIYQVMQQGWSFDQIRRIPLPYLISVELNDGTLPGSPEYDPSNRRFCGEGEYDLRGFVKCVKDMGYSGPWAVEVISEKLFELPLEELSRRAYETSLASIHG
ncbi:MAG: sugar phosphate isomerase/epimerase [Anaerolineales bacterium]